jgi:hypothetical protein
MGCTASVLDHDQQQDWVHSKLQVSEKVRELYLILLVRFQQFLTCMVLVLVKAGGITKTCLPTGKLRNVASEHG